VQSGVEAAAGGDTSSQSETAKYDPGKAPAYQQQSKIPAQDDTAPIHQSTAWHNAAYDSEAPPQAEYPTNPPPKVRGVRGKGQLVYSMLLNPTARHAHALGATITWAVTLFIIGVIFLPLQLTGNFPDSVSIQKEVGIYSIYAAKYCLYIVAALMGLLGAIVARRALRSSSSPNAFAISLFYLTILTLLATLGLTGYLIYKDSQLSAAWWQYLIEALIIVERLLYLLAIVSVLIGLNEAARDKEVAQVMMDSPVFLFGRSSKE